MIGAQHSLEGRQRASVERLGLLVLALFPVEDCQVIEGTQGVGMLSPQHTLTDRQVPCPEWFCLPVLAPLIEVVPGLKEQVSRFPKGHTPVINMYGTQQCMRDVSLTERPRLVAHLGKSLLNRSHGSFCPLGLLFLSKLVFLYFLYHAMDTIRLCLDVQPDERVARERFQCFVEREWVLGRGKRVGKHWS